MRRVNLRRRRKITAVTELTLTPLIDTALTLLVIFMVSAPMVHNAIKVQLPRGLAQEAHSKNQNLVVFIDAQGTIFFENKQVDCTMLLTLLKSHIQNDETVVYVKADRDAQYGKVLELVDTLKVVGGIRYVALATQKHL